MPSAISASPASTKEARGHVLAVLGEEQKRLADLHATQAKLKVESPVDPADILAALETRVDELRDGLRKGGIEALPAVEDLLGGDRLTATRREDGRWDLAGEADPIKVFYARTEDVKVGKKQKAAVTGNVSGVQIHPDHERGRRPG